MARKPPALAPGDPRHGTVNGYGNLGCRCEPCRAAHRAQHHAYMQRVRDSRQLVGDETTHGTPYRYDVGCRCDPCRQAHNAKSRAFKQRRQSAAK